MARSAATPAKKRVDQLLVERGLAESRGRAQALVMAGLVFHGKRRIDKPGATVPDDGAPALRVVRTIATVRPNDRRARARPSRVPHPKRRIIDRRQPAANIRTDYPHRLRGRASSRLPEHPDDLADHMHVLRGHGIGRVHRVGGNQPELGRVAAADGLDALDDESEPVSQHGQLAGGWRAARDVDDEPVVLADQGLHGVAGITANGGAFRRPP